MIKITKRDNEYMEDGYSYINSMEMVNKGVDMLFELIRTGVGDNHYKKTRRIPTEVPTDINVVGHL
ncbi:hypothetical protein F2Q70_00039598 [Brassica cretica]|uniref:Uncharacterized protein n=1 Tax=Brassica cretica TaxID=69181 RepID=A0A8S9KEN0_BRACR|nr:hypothetical protein F2Q70_00039598 [Brassica cretica]